MAEASGPTVAPRAHCERSSVPAATGRHVAKRGAGGRPPGHPRPMRSGGRARKATWRWTTASGVDRALVVADPRCSRCRQEPAHLRPAECAYCRSIGLARGDTDAQVLPDLHSVKSAFPQIFVRQYHPKESWTNVMPCQLWRSCVSFTGNNKCPQRIIRRFCSVPCRTIFLVQVLTCGQDCVGRLSGARECDTPMSQMKLLYSMPCGADSITAMFYLPPCSAAIVPIFKLIFKSVSAKMPSFRKKTTAFRQRSASAKCGVARSTTTS